VLVVDDDPDQCETLAELLAEYDCDVTPCSDPHRAIELSRAQRYDLVLLDILMHAMDGLELLRQIKPHGHACIVMLTGTIEPELKVAAIHAGADDVMEKPVDIPKLLEVAETVRRTGDCEDAPRSFMLSEA
jgi:DNA-binding response OmpR family regulator